MRHTAKEVARADELYDAMPLHGVSEVTGIPLGTLQYWQNEGMISTEADWQAEAQRGCNKANPQRAVNLTRLGYTQREAAEEMGVSPRTIRRYLELLDHI